MKQLKGSPKASGSFEGGLAVFFHLFEEKSEFVASQNLPKVLQKHFAAI